MSSPFLQGKGTWDFSAISPNRLLPLLDFQLLFFSWQDVKQEGVRMGQFFPDEVTSHALGQPDGESYTPKRHPVE